MKFFEKQYAKYESRYCAKHGRLKFLKRAEKYYKLYLTVAILDFILAILCSINGIAALVNKVEYIRFPNYIWYFSLATLWLLQAILWSIRLPFYKKKSLECEKELKANKEPGSGN